MSIDTVARTGDARTDGNYDTQAMGARVRRVLFVNCGSVGKPKDGDPRTGFAILSQGETRLEVTIERVPYDAEAVAREVAAAGLPEEYVEKLVAAA